MRPARCLLWLWSLVVLLPMERPHALPAARLRQVVRRELTAEEVKTRFKAFDMAFLQRDAILRRRVNDPQDPALGGDASNWDMNIPAVSAMHKIKPKVLGKASLDQYSDNLFGIPKLKDLGYLKHGVFAKSKDLKCGGKKGALKKAVGDVTGDCTDRSFGTLCMPGPCRTTLVVIKKLYEACTNSLDDDIEKLISKDWYDIENEACKQNPDKRVRLAIQFRGNFEMPPLGMGDRPASEGGDSQSQQSSFGFRRIAEYSAGDGEHGLNIGPFDNGQPNLAPADFRAMQHLTIRAPAKSEKQQIQSQMDAIGMLSSSSSSSS